MSYDDPNEYGVYLSKGEQEVHFPIGLAFDSEQIPEGETGSAQDTRRSGRIDGSDQRPTERTE